MQHFLVIFFTLFSINCFGKNIPKNHQKIQTHQQISQIFVNNKIITLDEINERFEFLIKDSKIIFNKKNQREALQNMVIDRMIEEELIRQKAKFYKITIEQNEIDFEMENLAQKKHKNLEKFKLFLQKNNWDYNNFSEQIESKLIWKKILTEIIKPNVSVSIAEIKEWLEKEKIEGQNDKYLLEDFVIEKSKNSQEFVNKIYEELQSQDNFKNFIENFLSLQSIQLNKNTSWFWASELNNSINQIIYKLKIGEYSKPILLEDGWHIFKLIDKRNDLKLSDKEYDFIKNQIINRKLEIAVKNYLQDLKRRAFIEYKY